MKSIYKRITAMLLALILCVSMVPASVFADEIEVSTENVDGGAVTKLNTSAVQTYAIGEQGKLRVLYYTLPSDSTIQTQTMGSLCGVPAHSIILSDGKTQAAAYCLNHELGATDMNGYTWEEIGSDSRSDVIGTIMVYGFQYSGQPSGDPPTPWGKGDDNDKWLVTQLLVWATCNGHIFMQGNHLIGIEAAVDADMQKIAPYAYNQTNFLAYYNQLKEKITKSRLIPSFASYPAENDLAATAAKTITMKWDGEKFAATVTDANAVLSNYNFRNAVSGVTISASGNSMTLTTDKPITSPVTSSTVTYRAQGGRGAVAVWRTNTHDSSQQDFATYTSGYDPVNAVITVKTEGEITAKASLVKTADDGKVSGITFTISGSDGKTYTKTTDSNGKFDISDLPVYTSDMKVITYTVTEQTPDRYVPVSSQSFTLDNGDVTVRFENKLKRGDLEITKTSEDGLVEGMRFHLYGTSYGGQSVDLYANTNAQGVAKFEDVPISGSTPYTVEEVNTPNKYIVPSSQSTAIKWNEVAKLSFTNKLKRGDLEIVKNAEDGLVSGLKFRLYGTSLSGESVNLTATTDSTGRAYFRDVLIGDYTIEETGTPNRYEVPASQSAPIEWDKVTSKEFQNKLKRGSLEVTKTSEDGLVEGMRFHLFGTALNGDAVDEYAVTDSTGVAKFENILISGDQPYTIEEVDTPARYVVPKSQTTPIEWKKVLKVSFENVLKRGDLEIIKNSEDGLVEGVKFHLYGTALNGDTIDEYATTNAQGVAHFEDILISGDEPYTVEEVDTAIRYGIPAAQKAPIEWEKVTTRTFVNVLKKFRVTVTKTDAETGDPQGDAKLGGAIYGIYKGGELVDTYTTDAHGEFTTKYYVCGDDWTIREIDPSEGYLLDTTVHPVGAEAKLYTVELNDTKNSVVEQVRKGNIAIIKHTDNGDTQIETPEAGAKFEVYLKASGSYAKAKESERDILVCDEFGFAQTKNLPYGVYIVHQTSGWDGRELMRDFEVYIAENGETYRYIINNANFESYIKIVKKDAETGKIIPAAGVGFQIFRPDGTKVEMSFAYPKPTTIDTFYTNDEGYLVTPEKLAYGKGYWLKEVQAPYGYVLDSDPIYFDVVQEDSETEDGLTVIVVERPNMPQKGIIHVFKSGEVFASVMENEGVYQPIYEDAYLKGATYEISAAEDIYTLDGTLRYEAGEVVAAIITGEDGTAVSGPLYLGVYNVKETAAPFGMVLDTEVHTVELAYAGQEVEITDTSAALYDQRQKVAVSLEKLLEQDKWFDIGDKGEINSVTFGLYAAEELTAADGTVIPADGLIEIVSVNEDGYVVCSTDLPFGRFYLKELTTDSHYVLSDENFDFTFEYAGQDTALVEIKANDGEAVVNELIRNTIKGFKFDRETKGPIEGAMFGLFYGDETEFTEENAVLTTESDAEGIFVFEDVPYGHFIVVELAPAEGYQMTDEIHHVYVKNDEVVIVIRIANDKLPEIHTTATVGDAKDFYASGEKTISDVVAYQHLTIGKLYLLVGVAMDKNTGKPLLINGKEVRVIHPFVPETASGETVVEFTFDASFITEDTDIVIFEELLADGEKLAEHADIADRGQTVTAHVPEIGTTATVNGEKEVFATDVFVLQDVVRFANLIPGLEHLIEGIVMDKTTGEQLVINDEPVTAQLSFTPDEATGEVVVEFSIDARYIKADTQLVVAETLMLVRDDENEVIAVHDDLSNEAQTITVRVPEIGTTATIGGEKEATAKGEITIDDVVAYKNLTPGKEYTVLGVLMNKATGQPLLINGKEIHSRATFTPKNADGEVKVSFVVEVSGITETTEIVVFEHILRDGVEIASHTDISSESQTVRLIPVQPEPMPEPDAEVPQTGDNRHPALWKWLLAISALGAVACGAVVYFDKRKRGKESRR